MKKRFLLAVILAALASTGFVSPSLYSPGTNQSSGTYSVSVNPGETISTVAGSLPASISSGKTQDTGAGWVELSGTTDIVLGQCFMTPANKATLVTRGWAFLKKLGSVDGNVRMIIETAPSLPARGVEADPSGDDCTSQWLPTDAVPSTHGKAVQFSFSNGCNLSLSTMYCAVLDKDSTYDGDFSTGGQSISWWNGQDDKVPCDSTWTNQTAPGSITYTSGGCDRVVYNGTNWTPSSNQDFSFGVGTPSLLWIQPGAFLDQFLPISNQAFLTVAGSGVASTSWSTGLSGGIGTASPSASGPIEITGLYLYNDDGLQGATLGTADTVGLYIHDNKIDGQQYAINTEFGSETKIVNNEIYAGGLDSLGARGVRMRTEAADYTLVANNTILVSLGNAAGAAYGLLYHPNGNVQSAEIEHVVRNNDITVISTETGTVMGFYADTVYGVDLIGNRITVNALQTATNNTVIGANLDQMNASGTSRLVDNVVNVSYAAGSAGVCAGIVPSGGTVMIVSGGRVETNCHASSAHADIGVGTGNNTDLTVRSVDFESFIDLGTTSTVDISPTTGSGTAGVASPLAVTVPGVTTGHVCNCEVSVDADGSCSVDRAIPTANTCTVAWTGCTNGADVIRCSARVVP